MAAENTDQGTDQADAFLKPGTILHLGVKNTDKPITCMFVGQRKKEYLAITPFAHFNVIKERLHQSATITVRFLSQNQIYEFQTRLIKHVNEPVDMILLEFPGKIKQRELRSHKRIRCFISAEVEMEHKEGSPVKGVIKDISKSGCCFHYGPPHQEKKLFDYNEHVMLRCQFPGIAGEQEALGKVNDLRDADGGTAVSIQFSDFPWWVPPYE